MAGCRAAGREERDAAPDGGMNGRQVRAGCREPDGLAGFVVNAWSRASKVVSACQNTASRRARLAAGPG